MTPAGVSDKRKHSGAVVWLCFPVLGKGYGFVFFLSRKTAKNRTNISVFLNISLKYIVLSYRNIIFVVQTLKIATVYLKTKLKGGGYQKEKI
ncbi:hypothetical protein [uncultured Bacteroides sp.]|uniref:hypothetical protein n=1 Tax=uncultured Bacteroides sp. TaxID=162156 RepID=UPI0026322524|nr:hypothetical protein [uncultured Bacteroides sp.]